VTGPAAALAAADVALAAADVALAAADPRVGVEGQ
jgi:hypothetical protein